MVWNHNYSYLIKHMAHDMESDQLAKTFFKNMLRLSKTPSGLSSMVRESFVSFWALKTAAESAESLVAVEEWDMVWLLFLAVVVESLVGVVVEEVEIV